VIDIIFPPELYRWVLFAGLAAHKIIWEFLKKSSPVSSPEATREVSLIKRTVKLGKSFFLVFLVIQTLFLVVLPITEQPEVIRYVGMGIFLLGLGTAVIGRVQLGKNWANLEDYQVISGQKLVQSGIYRYIRHPIYGGDMLLILGLELALNSWLFLLVIPLAIVVVRQTLKEEQILQKSFPGYREYRQTSKMFIPFIV
jgi:protein-S-isoprenylcysteine O-methyltransferase Ste14